MIESLAIFRKKVAKTQKELDKLNNTPLWTYHKTRILETKKELNRLVALEEYHWKQRARTDWLKGDDRNTSYFHAMASQRLYKNSIKGLENDHGAMGDREGSSSSRN